MNKLFVWLKLAFIFLVSLFFLTGATNDQDAEVQEFVPNEVLVKVKPEAGRAMAIEAIESLQAKVVTYLGKEVTLAEWDPDIRAKRSFLGDPYLLHIRVPEHIGTERAISLLKTNPNVEYAEKNGLCRPFVIPIDLDFLKQWGMRNIGQTGGKPDADIDATDAWNIFTGSPDVVVAVIDSGIDYNHLDLQANIWTNPNEIPGNGIDEDGNGYIDDYRGWNFVSGNNDPMDTEAGESHGTHIAGIIGAVGNNGEGVAGVCWTVKLMALRCGDGTYPVNNLINAIDYAIAMNARVMNASWGWLTHSQSLYEAILRARDKGILFVAAAGNYHWSMPELDNDKQPVYPASYHLDNILAVLATDYEDKLSPFSHYGKRSVNVGAPGGPITTSGIWSTWLGGGYGFKSGTSMAAPHVAGAAALAIGKCPPISHSQLKSRLMAKVDVLSSLKNKCVSEGRVNAYKLIYDPAAPNAPGNLVAVPTGWTTITLTWADNSTNEIGFEVQRKAPGMPDHAYLKSANANQTSIASIDDWTAVAGQTFFYKLRAYNMADLTVFTNEVNATIPVGAPLAPSWIFGAWEWGQGAVQLTWTDTSNNEQYYHIERKSEWETQWTQIAQLGQNYASHYDSGVAGDTIYYYRVKVTNPIGYANSDITSVYVPWY